MFKRDVSKQDELIKAKLAHALMSAGPMLLSRLQNYRSDETPADLLEAVETYLVLRPDDTEVREALDRRSTEGKNAAG